MCHLSTLCQLGQLHKPIKGDSSLIDRNNYENMFLNYIF